MIAEEILRVRVKGDIFVFEQKYSSTHNVYPVAMYFNLFRLLNKFYWIKKETNMKERTTARNKATNNDTYCRECLCFAPSIFVLRSFFFFLLFFQFS